jgi:fibronectin type III domain protein
MTAIGAALLTTLIATGLTQPANLGAVASSEIRIDLSWQDTSSNETGFEIRRSSSGPAGTFTVLATTEANVTRYVDSGLSASTQYCYRVAAFKTKGDRRDYSDPSAPACATTFQPPAPTAPSITRAAATSDSQIDVAVGSAASPECSG